MSRPITQSDIEALARRIDQLGASVEAKIIQRLDHLGQIAMSNAMVQRGRFCGGCGVQPPNPDSSWCPRCSVFTYVRGLP